MKVFSVWHMLTVITLVLVACSSPQGDQSAPPTDLAGTSWQLIVYGSQDEPASILPATTPTLNFGTDGSLGGFASCNTFGGSYSQSGNQLAINEIFSTLMACLEPGIMEQESSYLGALNAATTFVIVEGRLHIYYDSGVLVFDPV